MKIKSLPRDPKIYAVLAALWLVLWLLMPRTGKFNYNYRKGSPWTYETLVAQFDFPILKTADQITAEKEAAGSAVIPYYRFSTTAGQSSLRAVESLDLDQYAFLKSQIVNSLDNIYDRGVIAGGKKEKGEENDVIFIQKEKRATRRPATEVYNLTTAKAKLLADASKEAPELNIDSVFTISGVYDLIVPNLVFDKETTELVHAQSADYISPTQGFVNGGQIIVSEGELVTGEIYQMLESYKVEYEKSLGYNGPRVLLWLGNAVIALVLVLMLFLVLFYTNPYVFEDFYRYTYLVTVFAIAALAALLTERISPNLLYVIPFTLTVLYLMAFFKKRVVLPVYFVSLLPLLIFAHDGIELFLVFLVAGVVTMYVFQYFSKGWKQFVTAMIVFFFMAVVFLGFRLMNGHLSDMGKLFSLFLAAVLPVAGYPLVFLFEKIFGLVSKNRLVELCDTNNNKLLKELAVKAPGTFQHCLQVMNMADAAAESIGANVELARAGALYHDVGKMNNPQCFVENATMGNHYHDGLTPQESAREIIHHVSDGLAIAERYNLPQVVRDFIMTHHGTSCTAYFYNKYMNAGGDPSQAGDFFYNGKKPWTKEQTIVMLCDTLEAASRTLKDNSPETFDRFVDSIVESKMRDGQFSDSAISLKDIETVKSVLKSYLAQIYHERIAYPNRKKQD